MQLYCIILFVDEEKNSNNKKKELAFHKFPGILKWFCDLALKVGNTANVSQMQYLKFKYHVSWRYQTYSHW